jgi:hypothetical protein
VGGVDVQKGYLVGTFREYVDGGDSGLVWHGTIADLATVDRIAEQTGATWIMMDARYRTREVQEWAYAHAGYVPCMGAQSRAKALYTVNSLDMDEGKRTANAGRSIETLTHDADQLKDMLADMIGRKDGTRRWLIPRGYSTRPEYVAQMTAERCVNGRWVNQFDRPNHAWDSEVLCLLGAIWLGLYPVSVAEKREGGEA